MPDYLQTRLLQEQAEKQQLTDFAIVSAHSRGRRYSEPEHEYRTCFQRDRDRVIHCAAFRRLESKTQVFFDKTTDYSRTRLTHTLEVAQIARTMARILAVNPDLAESAALAHDLGHPPYGHCGEAVLNEIMAGQGGFEHNRQSLRIVEYLEHPYPAFRGLNLTFETRECLAKHETRWDNPDEKAEYGSGFAPIEGQIADLADSIAYNSHDLDDSLACGLIDEQALKDVELYQILKDRFDELHPQAHHYARQLRCAKTLIDILVVDVLEETVRRLRRNKPNCCEDIRQGPEKIISLSGVRQKQLGQLEQFLLDNVYQHPKVARAKGQACRELTGLFEYFLKDPSHLPDRYRQRMERQNPHQVICDYLAGMTDRYCHKLFEDLL
jgi:dGTPase